MPRKTAKQVREEARKLTIFWAEARHTCGDPEGASELRDLAAAISRIQLIYPTPA